METPSKPLLIDKRSAAMLLSISVRTVENLIARRRLPVRRIGKRVLIPLTALEAFAKGETGRRELKAEVRAGA